VALVELRLRGALPPPETADAHVQTTGNDLSSGEAWRKLDEVRDLI
jgi:hypothetical protein